MLGQVLKKVFGSQNERILRSLQPIVDGINSLELEISKLSDGELRAKTDEFRRRLKEGETYEDILPEAFALVREVSKRVLGMRPFDVQVMGAIVLHQGKIAEMKTGEGKTLVATMPVYLNALTGKGVHVVTVNDYLAKRDAEWMGPVYKFLGLSVGAIIHDMDFEERKRAYLCDVTYGTNNEFGFDYLRDNMAIHPEARVQRGLHYAIVDEVDSILIDEARTPLIISGPAEESTEMYYIIDKMIPKLKRGEDYKIDEKARTVLLSEQGVAKAEKLLGVRDLYENVHIDIIHHINQALKAHTLFKRDVDYVVKEGQVIIVDEFTGRLMPGRRYSDGLHQALEAKEGVKIERENQTLAAITFQNYFRLYEKLAGMTGTAETEAQEFWEIYKLEVVVIPTNKPMIRIDYPDVIYRTQREKYNAVVEEIARLYKMNRPVLVGTTSIEKNEMLSELLKKKGIPHSVLNAKYHEKEAEIIARAGQKGAVTVATNMAGRGVDIVLGEGVVEMGGLHVIGTERHEARRIDNQLRGRSGRQGDPGSSRFYLSLEDDLLRIFGSDRIAGIMDKLGMEEGQEISHPLVSRAIETAQKRVEAHNFEIRKHLLEYDNVMNKQRELIYGERCLVLEGENLRDHILAMADDVVDKMLSLYTNPDTYPEEWDLKGLGDRMGQLFPLHINGGNFEVTSLTQEKLRDVLLQAIRRAYEDREREIGESMMRQIERLILLQVVDSKWKDHLHAMDYLREGIGLRAYGQIDPLTAYKEEAYQMFMKMIEGIKEDVVNYIFKVRVVTEERPQSVTLKPAFPPTGKEAGFLPRKARKIGRNDPCPCGSGRKYKKCCGR